MCHCFGVLGEAVLLFWKPQPKKSTACPKTVKQWHELKQMLHSVAQKANNTLARCNGSARTLSVASDHFR